jgi:hypothetical protein
MAEIFLVKFYELKLYYEVDHGVSLQEQIDRMNAFADTLMPDLLIHNDLLTKLVNFYESKGANIDEREQVPVTPEERPMLLEWQKAAKDLVKRMNQHRANCGQLFNRFYGPFTAWLLVLHIANHRRNWGARRDLVAFADSAFDNGSMPSYMNELILIEISKNLEVKHPFCLGVYEKFPDELYGINPRDPNQWDAEEVDNDFPLSGADDVTRCLYRLLK